MRKLNVILNLYHHLKMIIIFKIIYEIIYRIQNKIWVDLKKIILDALEQFEYKYLNKKNLVSLEIFGYKIIGCLKFLNVCQNKKIFF